MAHPQLPAGLVSFLNEYIHSLRQLELLLALHSDQAREWTAETLAKEIYSNVSSTTKWLEEFCRAGLVVCITSSPPKFRYEVAKTSAEEMVTLLVSEYKLRPLKISEAIVNRSDSQMMDFMDAFRSGKGKDEKK